MTVLNSSQSLMHELVLKIIGKRKFKIMKLHEICREELDGNNFLIYFMRTI